MWPQSACTRGCIVTLMCVFSNVSSNHLLGQIQNHTGCICLTFLRYVFSNVSSNCLHKRMHNHTGCICLTFVIEHIRANFWTLCEHRLCGCANVWAFCEYGFVFVLILACEFSCKGSITKLCCFFLSRKLEYWRVFCAHFLVRKIRSCYFSRFLHACP